MPIFLFKILSYCLFVTFFPQLIAGPIVYHSEMMPQFDSLTNKMVNWQNLSKGVFAFSIGLFKKVIVADSFAVWANAGFDNPNTLSCLEAWCASLSYTFQLYYDFSGYSDMAIGAALMFNIKLPINFNSPYKATNIKEFWQCWHMTLSRWFRDYVYIPLGGNRRGDFRTFYNLFVAFMLCGLWHGAGWTFVVWGGVHGGALIFHRIWQGLGFRISKFGNWLITFIFINMTWVIFRSTTLSDAWRMIMNMLGIGCGPETISVDENFYFLSVLPFVKSDVETVAIYSYPSISYILIFGAVALIMPNTSEMISIIKYDGKNLFRCSLKDGVIAGFLLGISMTMMLVQVSTEFLYFNF